MLGLLTIGKHRQFGLTYEYQFQAHYDGFLKRLTNRSIPGLPSFAATDLLKPVRVITGLQKSEQLIGNVMEFQKGIDASWYDPKCDLRCTRNE